MTDKRWPGDEGWQKWQQIIEPRGIDPTSGKPINPINVHYAYNPLTGAIDDFKIVIRGPGAQ